MQALNFHVNLSLDIPAQKHRETIFIKTNSRKLYAILPFIINIFL